VTLPPRSAPARPTASPHFRRQPVVLLPGALCDAALWRHQISSLSDIADTRIGDLTRDNSVGAMAERVLAGLPPRFALAGLSLGGYVALEIMRRVPDRVTRLALLDTSARPETSAEIQLARLADGQGTRGAGVTPLMTLLVHPMRLGDRRLATIVGAMAERVGRKAFLRQQQAILTRPDSRPDLGAIRCPTLLLCGRQDQLVQPALHEEMAAAIEGARLVIVEDCGHLAPLEQPEAVSAALRDWLTA
jgi:pimeloyl-ACP methyl ester carboxylesterase